jgi:hypothetical protein
MAIRKFDEQQDIEAQRCAETPHGTPLNNSTPGPRSIPSIMPKTAVTADAMPDINDYY